MGKVILSTKVAARPDAHPDAHSPTWERLGDLCETSTGGTPSRGNSELFRGTTPWVKSGELPDGLVTKTEEAISDQAFCRCNVRLLPKGTLLMAMYGATVGKLGILGMPAATNQAVCAITPNSSLDRDYLFYWLLSIRQELIADSFGGAQPNISQSVIRNLSIPIVPTREQRRLAAHLRDQLAEVAKARAAAEAQIAAAQVLPAAHLRAIFDGSALKKWPIKALADVAEISGGVTLGRDFRGRLTRQVPYLRVANVKDGWLDLSHVKEVEATEAEIDDCRLGFGDLLLTEGGDPDKLGRGTYWQEQLPECIHQNHIFRVRFDLAAFDPAFAASQVGSPYGKAYFLAHAKQTTGIATINRTVLSKFPFLVPPFVEQRAVAARLEAEKREATSLTAALAEKLTALDHLPAALLREAFNGRV